MKSLLSDHLKVIRLGAAVVCSLGFAASARAQMFIPLLDQIGSASAATGNPVYDSQIFEPTYAAYDTAAVDDFTAPVGETHLGEVQAVVGSYSSNYAGPSQATGWNVEIWSSEAAAAASLTGDIASVTLSPAQVTLTTTGTYSVNQALVTLPVSLTLPKAGTYYIGVNADYNYTANGVIGIETYLPGTGGKNGFQTDPSGGYFTGLNQVKADIAYRVFAVPEPSTRTPLLLGVGLLVTALVRRCRRSLNLS